MVDLPRRYTISLSYGRVQKLWLGVWLIIWGSRNSMWKNVFLILRGNTCVWYTCTCKYMIQITTFLSCDLDVTAWIIHRLSLNHLTFATSVMPPATTCCKSQTPAADVRAMLVYDLFVVPWTKSVLRVQRKYVSLLFMRVVIFTHWEKRESICNFKKYFRGSEKKNYEIKMLMILPV